MTEKEAREIIIKERDSLKANPMVKVEDCLYEAFDFVIKALEQPSCEDAVEGTKSSQPDLGINLNDKIKVKLTDLGKDIFYHRYDWILERNPKSRAYIKPHYPKVNEEGYTTFLLWEFMQLYGKHIGMAAPNVILPLEIIKCEDE